MTTRMTNNYNKEATMTGKASVKSKEQNMQQQQQQQKQQQQQ